MAIHHLLRTGPGLDWSYRFRSIVSQSYSGLHGSQLMRQMG